MTALLQKPYPSTDERTVWIPRPAAGSLAGFRSWYARDDFPEDGRICYLGGEIFIDMGHERISSHVALKGDLTMALVELARQLDVGRFLTDGCRIVNEDAELSSEPDGVYITWAAVAEGRVKLQASRDGADVSELVGTPDIVIEIVSPSSVRKDKTVLPELYFRAGIPEYWLFDARKDELSFEILARGAKGYEAVPDREGWLASRVLDREVRLERTQDPIGLWQYRLLARSIGS